jgi:two-component system cell cycle response regulator CpdR
LSYVLLVEDGWEFRQVLAEVLHEEGYNILQAPSADAAVDLLATASVRLMVTDVNLPGRLSGIDLAIAARSLCPGLPIIFISGRPGTLADAYIAVDDPMAFLIKPFRVAALLERVARLAGVE